MHPKYPEVVRLRKLGQSYREIAKQLDISKNSVSRWCKNLELPEIAKKIIEKKTKRTKYFLEAYNRQKHERVVLENKEIREDFNNRIKPITDYELLLLGAALYWGEGCKRHASGISYVSLVNSDPDMIKIFLRFVKEILEIPENRLKLRIQIHPNIKKEEAINYWSNVVKIPPERFYIIKQISRASLGRMPKNLLPFGTMEIRVYSRQKFFEIMGMIDGLIKQAI